VIRNCRPRTIKNYLYTLGLFAMYYKDTDLDMLSQYQIARTLQSVAMLRYSDHIMQKVKRSTKMFYTMLRGREFPGFIHPGKVYSELRKCDLICRKELYCMMAAALTLRDKAMLAVLYDGALRKHELVGMRVRDVDLSGKLVHITVTGKTGTRVLPLTFSSALLKRYIKATPRFCNSALLWDISKDGLRDMLDDLKKRAGIYNKRIYPYLFRHSRITELSSVLSGMQLKRFAGWTLDSPMLRNYVHLNSEDLDAVVARGDKMLCRMRARTR